MIDEAAAKRTEGWIKEAVDGGAKSFAAMSAKDRCWTLK
jgi:hypothetical protein